MIVDDVYWWWMMSSEGEWCLMMVNKCLLMLTDVYWWWMVSTDGEWCLLAVNNVYWWWITSRDCGWCLLMMSSDCEWCLHTVKWCLQMPSQFLEHYVKSLLSNLLPHFVQHYFLFMSSFISNDFKGVCLKKNIIPSSYMWTVNRP